MANPKHIHMEMLGYNKREGQDWINKWTLETKDKGRDIYRDSVIHTIDSFFQRFPEDVQDTMRVGIHGSGTGWGQNWKSPFLKTKFSISHKVWARFQTTKAKKIEYGTEQTQGIYAVRKAGNNWDSVVGGFIKAHGWESE